MQTFLPYDSFVRSAHCLDMKRLGKQRVEVIQILNAIDGKSTGWVNHPAVLMWWDYREALIEYGLIVCTAWRSRYHVDTVYDKLETRIQGPIKYPHWLGDKRLHNSHRGNLVRKDKRYRLMFPDADPSIEYFWPK